jgi:acetoin utilization protein AcuB
MGLYWMLDGMIQKDRPIIIPQSRPPKAKPDRETVIVPERPPRSSQSDPGEQVRVSQVMTRNLMVLTEDHTVDDALNLTEEYGFNHVPVVDSSGRLTGILSDRDLLRSTAVLDDPLSQHMTRRVVVSRPSTFLKDAARLLIAEKISCLPIIDTRLHPVGLVAMADVLGYLVSHPAMELWS